ncbi:hypothetical protein SUDANB6_00507 [Streptomyces sp. enrichment culture]
MTEGGSGATAVERYARTPSGTGLRKAVSRRDGRPGGRAAHDGPDPPLEGARA